MTDSYITRTGAFLPGKPVSNAEMHRYIGRVPLEGKIKQRILKANGIESRHYALDTRQAATHNLYELAAQAVQNCLGQDAPQPDYLSAGTTYGPYIAPGVASLLHDQLGRTGLVSHALEINSNAGICSSGAQAIVNAARAVKSGEARAALCVGVEHASSGLKSSAFRTTYDLPTILRDVRSSKWFMSVFLRFMLSDGAGAFLIEPQPRKGGQSFRIDWTYSRSFAHEAPLCMHIETNTRILSQNIRTLAEYMAPLSKKAVQGALQAHDEKLSSYTAVLPHMSSYYFEPSVQQIMAELSPEREVPYWTNLRTAGNTGAASIFIMLDEYTKTSAIQPGQRLLLFVPESGQFNYVLVSLTAV